MTLSMRPNDEDWDHIEIIQQKMGFKRITDVIRFALATQAELLLEKSSKADKMALLEKHRLIGALNKESCSR